MYSPPTWPTLSGSIGLSKAQVTDVAVTTSAGPRGKTSAGVARTSTLGMGKAGGGSCGGRGMLLLLYTLGLVGLSRRMIS